MVNANERARELFDAGPDYVGTSVREFLRPVPDDVFSQLPEASDSDTEITVAIDGERRHYLLSVSPVGDAERRGRILLFHDITGRKRRERELQRQNDRLDEFASVVSHDLRNPLNVADGHVQMARETVETGDATLETSLDGARLEGDPGLLRNALENLFRNAVEHNDPPVTVTVGTVAGGFYVADDGSGIPPDGRDSVFEYGYSTSESSTGFGLSIVEDVAEAHGWSIAVGQSKAGGVRFDFGRVDGRR